MTSNIRKSIPTVRRNHPNILSGTPVNGPTNRLPKSRRLSLTAIRIVRPTKSRGLIPSRSIGIETGALYSPREDRLRAEFAIRKGSYSNRELVVAVLRNALTLLPFQPDSLSPNTCHPFTDKISGGSCVGGGICSFTITPRSKLPYHSTTLF